VAVAAAGATKAGAGTARCMAGALAAAAGDGVVGVAVAAAAHGAFGRVAPAQPGVGGGDPSAAEGGEVAEAEVEAL